MSDPNSPHSPPSEIISSSSLIPSSSEAIYDPEGKPITRKADPYIFALRVVFWVFCVGVVSFALVQAWPAIVTVLNILTPFIVGLILAYILHPVVRAMERRYHMKRSLGVVVVAGGLIFLVTLFLLILVPILYNQTISSYEAIASYARHIDKSPIFKHLPEKTQRRIQDILGSEAPTTEVLAAAATEALEGTTPKEAEAALAVAATAEPTPPQKKAVVVAKDKGVAPTPTPAAATQTRAGPEDETKDAVKEAEKGVIASDPSSALHAINKTVLAAFSVFGRISSFLIAVSLTFIITFYMLLEMSKVPPVLRRLLPGRNRERIWDVLLRANKDVAGFLRGQLTACAIVGFNTTILLLAIGPRKFSVLIGFMAGVAHLIPYLGPVVGAAPCIMWALLSPEFTSWGARGGYVLAVLIGFSVVEMIDGFFVQPLVVGRAAQLHPLAVLLALAIGAQFGIGGMIVAVPVACVVKVFFTEYFWKGRTDFLESALVEGELDPPKPANGPSVVARFFGFIRDMLASKSSPPARSSVFSPPPGEEIVSSQEMRESEPERPPEPKRPRPKPTRRTVMPIQLPPESRDEE